MKYVSQLLCAAMLFLVSVYAQEENHMGPTIIPTPQQVVPKNVRFKIAAGTKIILGANSRPEQFAAQQINDAFGSRKEAQLKIAGENSLRKLPASFIFIGSPLSDYGRQLLRERSISMLTAPSSLLNRIRENFTE